MSLHTADSWKSLPHKDQLAVLTLCRIVDFFQMVSFQTISYYQLKSFDPLATEKVLSWQTGVALASFTASQSCTAIPWGYMAEAKWCGRKNVILIGLMCTSLSCIGVAFSTSFVSVVLFRAAGGAMNGTVGVVRTMMSEVIRHKRHQSRAFLLLPASFSVAALTGPVFAGWLSDPVTTYPNVLGNIQWLKDYPYSLPSLLSALLLILISLTVLSVLRETLDGFDPRLSLPLARRVWDFLTKIIHIDGAGTSGNYSRLTEEHHPILSEDAQIHEKDLSEVRRPRTKLPFRRIWTSNVILTMISQAFFEFHLGAFGSAWPLLVSSPKESHTAMDGLDQRFIGGLGLSPQSLGYTTAFAGLTGLLLQFLFYPAVHKKYGTVKCYRLFSLFFPVVYAFSPFLVVIAGSSVNSSEVFVWVCMLFLLLMHSTSRIFCVPASITLLNNCSPHPSVLGIVHGIGQATAAAFRTIGPVCAGYLHGVAIANGAIGLSWWVVSGIAFIGWVTSLVIREGSGHEIILPGEEIKEDDALKV